MQALLNKKWKEQPDYKYTCSQFKSIRQDLTVQHIFDNFTVEVYETHARVALQVVRLFSHSILFLRRLSPVVIFAVMQGDLSEYNQCQTQLMELYERDPSFRTNFYEFTCYRVLYFLVTDQQSALNSGILGMTTDTRAADAVNFALQIRECVTSKLINYVRFFALYKSPPSSCLHARHMTQMMAPGIR